MNTIAMKNIDDYFADWESHVFGYGYGTGEQHVLFVLKQFLAAIPVPVEGKVAMYDHEVLEMTVHPTVAWLLINTLIHADVIEYGTSPRRGWLTPKGKVLKAYVDGKTRDELLAVLSKDDDYVPCAPTYCNCPTGGCGTRNPFWSD